MRGTLAVFVLTGVAWAQNGSADPAFANIPFDRWVDDGDAAHMKWTAKVLPLELSNHQRLQAKVEIVLDGEELAKRRGKGFMVMLVEFTDSQNRVYRTHEAIDLQLVREDAGKSNVTYTPPAFVMPGDYRISLVIFDTATQEHSGMRLPLRVLPLKNDALPAAWRDLPPVEFPKITDLPDNLFFPDISSRLHLPLETQRAVRVELLVNASPLSTDEPSRPRLVNNRSLANVIPALKVISQTEVRNGTLNVSLLDLTTQHVIFRQDAVHDLDWTKLAPALKQSGSNVIDVHALENRPQNVQFFLSQVRERIGASGRNPGTGGPMPVLIVLSGPMAFGSGEDLRPIELGDRPEAEVFYIRYHSIPPPSEPVNPYAGGSRRGGRRMGMPAYGRTPVASEPVDSLEKTLKPLRPHLFDVSTPEEFRKALSQLLDEISAR